MRRWTETTKWQDRWFRRLVPTSKLFYLYLLDECDEAGVWEIDFDLFAVMSGISISPESLIEDLGNRIQVLEGEQILVRKFLPYQQPKGLQAHVPLHQKIQRRLDVHGLVYDEGRVSLVGDTLEDTMEGGEVIPSVSLVSVSVPVPVKKRRKKEESEEKEEELPESLDCPEFREVWKQFKAYRKEVKRPFTDNARKLTLNRLAKVTPETAIAAIHATIERGWSGVDPAWLKRNGNRGQPIKADRDYEHCLED